MPGCRNKGCGIEDVEAGGGQDSWSILDARQRGLHALSVRLSERSRIQKAIAAVMLAAVKPDFHMGRGRCPQRQFSA